jgi:ABC-type branched-subunit amino acid transport system substrate-binding protein
LTKSDAYFNKPKPIRLGVLMDLPERHYKFAFPIYDFICAQYTKTVLHRGVELVKQVVAGPPAGYIDDVMRGYHALCDAGVIAVIGPNHSDNNLAITRHAEARQVPVVTLGAIHSHISQHVFNVGWGSVPEDAFTVASWLQQNGHKNVTLTFDNAAHCRIYAHWFRIAAARMQIRIVAESCVSEVNNDTAVEGMKAVLEEHRAMRPDAIVCFGTGASQINWARVVHESGWDVPRIMNGAFFQANYAYTHEIFDGWVGTGLWDDGNRTLAALRTDFAAAHPEMADVAPEILAMYRDGMVALLEGVAAAPIMTPEGVLTGLENVRMIPAAMGGDRTTISFGPYDHKGHKGMDYMVVRRLHRGKLTMEGRFEPVFTGKSAAARPG